MARDKRERKNLNGVFIIFYFGVLKPHVLLSGQEMILVDRVCEVR